jgi:pimeloyl-ACP methyl ester carboxylesterase
LEAFQNASLDNFNVIAPDLMGFGCSSNATNEDYSFASQINHLYKLINELGISEFYLVGHSMGADIATHLVANNPTGIRGLINIEGNLTRDDIFISREAVSAHERNEFEIWFGNNFMGKTVLEEWASVWPSCKRYYASLWFCRPHAFLSSALEIDKRNLVSTDAYETETGLLFEDIRIPKVYCWGGALSEPTKKFIEDKSIPVWGKKDAFHWVMIDKQKEFYGFVQNFVRLHGQ